MKQRLTHLREQGIVITGASSGTGLATARSATQRGAHVFETMYLLLGGTTPAALTSRTQF